MYCAKVCMKVTYLNEYEIVIIANNKLYSIVFCMIKSF